MSKKILLTVILSAVFTVVAVVACSNKGTEKISDKTASLEIGEAATNPSKPDTENETAAAAKKTADKADDKASETLKEKNEIKGGIEDNDMPE